MPILTFFAFLFLLQTLHSSYFPYSLLFLIMSKLHIAIIGGGLGGATLARGLLRHPNVSFDVFEYKSTFAEQGAAISLANSALKSLSLIGVHVDSLLKDIGGIPYTSVTTGVVSKCCPITYQHDFRRHI